MRLNRFLALTGVASRRACDEIIRQGRVKVDGARVDKPGLTVEIGRNVVTLDGKVVTAVEAQTWLLNKPVKILSAVKDARGGRTVADLAREAGIEARLFPVGRLDKMSRGLILMSNEGDLAHRLIHPRYGVEKIYRVRINLPITRTQMRRFAVGLELEDGKTSPCRIKELHGKNNYEVILSEGRKRQIRRMFEALNRRVLDLQRVRMGPLGLSRLPEGEMRRLTEVELIRLKQAVGLG
jgi:23S rRNA pseudouridine2605 synthase